MDIAVLLGILLAAVVGAAIGWWLRGRNDGALKAHATEAATAAALTAAQGLSSKLLDDHKRETQAAEARVEAVRGTLVKQMQGISDSITKLDDRVDKTGGGLETVLRALSNPGGAGQLAEVGLANTLKSFGLEAGRDFQLQQSTVDEETGRRLRPDAVVFLPTDTVLVIDCKASKHFLAIAEREGTPQEQEAYEGLARTMNLHLKALMEKDYRNAVLAASKQAGRPGEPHVISMMYLPNEAALEKLRRADPEFFQKAREAGIIPAGPAGLHSALQIASAEIRRLQQMENQQEIATRVRALLESVAVVLGHASRLGGGLKTAVEAFARFSSSVNGRLLPRARGLERVGIEAPKPLPSGLPNFSVQSGEDVIEAESAEIEPPPQKPRLLAE